MEYHNVRSIIAFDGYQKYHLTCNVFVKNFYMYVEIICIE